MSKLPKLNENGRGWKLLQVVFMALGQAMCAGVAAFATRDIFAHLRLHDNLIPTQPLILIVFAGLGIAVLRYMERVTGERIGQDYVSELRLRLFKHLSRLPNHVMEERRRGAVTLRFVGDLSAIRNWISAGIARLISSSIVLPLATLAVFLINPALGAAASIPIFAGIALMIIVAPRLGKVHSHLRSRRGNLAIDMSERAPFAPELRLMGRMKIEQKSLLRRTQDMIAASVKRVKAKSFLRAIPDAISAIAAASVFYVAFQSNIRPAEVAGSLAAVGLMVQPMRDLAGVWDRYRSWLAARDKCLNLLEKSTLRIPRSPDVEFTCKPRSLRFKDVSFGILKNINAEAKKGKKIAILGPNGGGKSTLLKLAAGLDAPDLGKVRLGDRSPISLNSNVRKRMIGYVSMRTPILAGSLRRALTMGIAEMPCDTRIKIMAETFGLGEVLERLGGLDGKVAELGGNLSSGEIRRVMLTRAALSEAHLLLLDEPDDALDAEGPQLLLKLINSTDATTLLITHNKAIARSMDEIWFIENGQLVEQGLPDEVLSGSGPIAAFFTPRSAA
ncbi:ABC transporter ATP-binding protein [Ahrensia sp. 13_GOM-1096m]|uniref:ATP-binding cassette domain-containing protein n=1 Tax=Ahrensia sp. 13_GOM-1096m TaxID=1380380 RepID=UPI00047DAA2B|nr:ABC transporter ATP-binding protein [Ahrensia sp. 13_GOM-1096m]